MIKLVDFVLHKVIRLPYSLSVVEFRSPKRPVRTIVLLHGIGNNAHSWDDLVDMLPENIRIIGVDLLGFGNSPKPVGVSYNAKSQARSLGLTLLKLVPTQKITIVGHSLGALVAIEVARRYPHLVDRLILCSPPFYKLSKKEIVKGSVYESSDWRSGAIVDGMLKDIYRAATKRPDLLVSLSPYVMKLGLANKTLNIDKNNVQAYIGALSSSVINQNSLDRASKLNVETRIIYGALDPLVIGANIEGLAKVADNITARKIVAGHEVVGRYVKILAKEILS